VVIRLCEKQKTDPSLRTEKGEAVKKIESLQQRQQIIKEDIAAHLDLLIGSVTTKGPQRTGHNLTAKVQGKTRSRHIPKGLAPRVREMTQRHNKVRALIRKLSDVNWKLLRLQNQLDQNP
jgi:hypothetical protein